MSTSAEGRSLRLQEESERHTAQLHPMTGVPVEAPVPKKSNRPFIPPPLGNPALKGRGLSKGRLGRVRNSAQNRKNSRALRPEFLLSL